MIGFAEKIEEQVEPQTQTSGKWFNRQPNLVLNQLYYPAKLNMLVLCDLGDLSDTGELLPTASSYRTAIAKQTAMIPGVVESFAMTGKFGVCVHIQANKSKELGEILGTIQAFQNIVRADGILIYKNNHLIYSFPPMLETSASCFTLISVQEGTAISVVSALSSMSGIHEFAVCSDFFFDGYKYNIYIKVTRKNGTELGELIAKIQNMSEVYATYSNFIF